MNPDLITEATRIFFRSIAAKRRGFRKFQGSPEQICEKIVEGCWNGQHFDTSHGHFKQYWTRDTAMPAQALAKLGHKDRLSQTMAYALSRFKKAGRIGTMISPGGRVLDFPDFTPESIAYTLRTLKYADNKNLIKQYKGFLEAQAIKAFKAAVDKNTGLVRTDKNFSTMKDQAIRQSPCYTNCMLGMASNLLNELKLDNPFKEFNYQKLIKDKYWIDSYFLDDLSGKSYISGDANTFPFWTGVFKNKSMFKAAVESMQSVYLDRPFPLKYTQHYIKGQYNWVSEAFTPNYEGDTIWLHLGLCFLETLHMFKHPDLKEYLEKYDKMISHFKTFPEVLESDGSPYKSAFYYCDEGMLWCAAYLRIKRAL